MSCCCIVCICLENNNTYFPVGSMNKRRLITSIAKIITLRSLMIGSTKCDFDNISQFHDELRQQMWVVMLNIKGRKLH